MTTEVTMSSNRKIYFSPWLDRSTGEEYGPKSHATLVKHTRAAKDWSFRVSTPSKVAKSADAAQLRQWMRLQDGTRRTVRSYMTRLAQKAERDG
jgi:hypothetical protein